MFVLDFLKITFKIIKKINKKIDQQKLLSSKKNINLISRKVFIYFLRKMLSKNYKKFNNIMLFINYIKFNITIYIILNLFKFIFYLSNSILAIYFI
jgi:hypothetical protein